MASDRPVALPALTSLRFFAALHVLLYHFAQGQVAALPEFVRTFIASGNTGVTFFFVLSGFILGYNYLGRMPSSREFYWRRFARIYPVYGFALIFALPFFMQELRAEMGWREVGQALAVYFPVKFLMLQAWFEPMVLKWNGPSWSLSVEALFYLVFPGLALLAVRLDRTGAICAGLGSLVLLHLAHLAKLPLPLVSLPLFLLGISLASLHRFVKPVSWLRPISVLILVVVIGNLPWIEVNVPGSSALFAACFGFLVFTFATGSSSQAGLAAPWLVLLGEASYSLYIIHEPLAALFQAVGKRMGGLTMASPVLFWSYLVGAVLFSIFLYRKLELPMQKALLGLRKRPAPARS